MCNSSAEAASISTSKVCNYFKNTLPKDHDLIYTTAEGVITFYSVKHDFSFRSHDSLNLFHPFSIKKFFLHPFSILSF